MVTYKIYPSRIAALVHVTTANGTTCDYIYAREGVVEKGLLTTVEFSDLPDVVRVAINNYFERMMTLPVSSREDVLDNTSPLWLQVKEEDQGYVVTMP